jgi:hypothetical protein
MSTYTPSLGLELITPGSQAGLWGNTTNNSLNLIDQAITGVTPISFASASGSTYTLTDFNGAADESRAAVLNVIGTATGANTIVVPNKQKTYLVRNSTGQDVTFQTAVPGATYAVGAGYSILIFCDGNNNVYTGIASPGVGTLSVNAGGTGTTSFVGGGFVKSSGGTNALSAVTTVNAATELSGATPVANGGTGAVSLVNNGLLVGKGTATVQSLIGGSSGQVATWNGSEWVAATPSTGSVASVSATSPLASTGGTNPNISLSGIVPIANGGTGSSTAAGALASLGAPSLAATQSWTGTNTFTSPTYVSLGSNTQGLIVSGGGYTGGIGPAAIQLAAVGTGMYYSTNSINFTLNNVNTFSVATSAAYFTTPISVNSGNQSSWMYTTQEGQLGLQYGISSSYGWHIGEAVGHEFIIYTNSGAVGQYMTYSSSTWQTRSDRRIKADLEVIPNALDKMDKINGYTGRMIDDETNTRHPYLIAQEIQEVLPEAVTHSSRRDNDGDGIPDDLLGLGYTDVIPLLVQAIKELKAEVVALKAAK